MLLQIMRIICYWICLFAACEMDTNMLHLNFFSRSYEFLNFSEQNADQTRSTKVCLGTTEFSFELYFFYVLRGQINCNLGD